MLASRLCTKGEHYVVKTWCCVSAAKLSVPPGRRDLEALKARGQRLHLVKALLVLTNTNALSGVTCLLILMH